ncbi:MAG: hypothetical protein JWL85_197 [Candidatus Saccharibacteria bacterium]|nr:hypothetical protein [Candidatus Saccharibacteria bacterium]
MSNLEHFQGSQQIALPGGVEYTAMSVSPLEYMPYAKQPDFETIGFAGVIADNGSALTVARLGEYDTETSFKLMYGWLKPAAEACLPESGQYPEDLITSVMSEVRGQEPLALLQLERNERGDHRISLAAQTKLGEISLKRKAELGIAPSTQQTHSIHRFMTRKKQNERQLFGETNYEAIIAGGALISKLFSGSHVLPEQAAARILPSR